MDSLFCPYLGRKNDAETLLAYPSTLNCCNRVKYAEIVSLKYQSSHCLTANHKNCIVFQNEQNKPFPKHLIHKDNGNSTSKKPIWISSAIIILIITTLGIFAAIRNSQTDQPSNPNGSSSSLQPVPSATLFVFQAQNTPTQANATITPLPSATLVPTNTPQPTATTLSGPTPGPGLETPIVGVSPPLLIHQVAEGESMALLARLYHTSEAAINAVNYFLPSPLWQGWLIIIPLNITDPTGLPTFEVYIANDNSKTAASLAAELQTDLNQLKYYNQLSDEKIPSGRWLLIPRIKPTTAP